MSDKISPIIYPRDKHNISRRQIDSDALKIMYRLMRHGFKAYLVGGGVRDLLLQIQPKDYDIGTDARPRQIKSIFRNSRIIGRRFKLVHIYFGGDKIIEVATFRAQDSIPETIELNENGQKDSTDLAQIESTPINENIYGTDQTDAFRRDITINGLFYDLSTFSVIDYVGGVKDLDEKIIRIIGDPDTRFAEDPVRLIRTIRHAARIGFTIEEDTYKSLVKNRILLKQASQVRLYEELRKDLISGHSYAILKLLNSSKLLEYLLPELLEFNGDFLNPENNSSDIFVRADSLVKNHIGISTSSILSALTLFVGLPGLLRKDLIDRFGSKQEIALHFKECFPVLAVPRKECEKIILILNSWYDLVKSDPEAIRTNRLRGKDFLPDLIGLFRLVGENESDYKLIELLEDLDQIGDDVKTPTRRRPSKSNYRRSNKRRNIKRFI